ncbi:HK97 gp10 family phage protein [Deinococcus rufus]|uniref:HK97 gp10 family phage protein n=1 Tax=Deinococcus rufus TaxID=2136097 RepID=A0ABV7Z969_9DEIO
MTLKLRRGHPTLLADRRRALKAALPRLAQRARDTAEAQAQRGLQLNVYGTVEGAYRRTHRLEASVYAAAQVTGGRLNVVVGDRAEYASFVEFGTGPHELTEPQLLAYLQAAAEPRLLRFGRSGQAYLLPGPYLTPAVFIARYQTRQTVQTLLRSLWAAR